MLGGLQNKLMREKEGCNRLSEFLFFVHKSIVRFQNTVI